MSDISLSLETHPIVRRNTCPAGAGRVARARNRRSEHVRATGMLHEQGQGEEHKKNSSSVRASSGLGSTRLFQNLAQT